MRYRLSFKENRWTRSFHFSPETIRRRCFSGTGKWTSIQPHRVILTGNLCRTFELFRQKSIDLLILERHVLHLLQRFLRSRVEEKKGLVASRRNVSQKAVISMLNQGGCDVLHPHATVCNIANFYFGASGFA